MKISPTNNSELRQLIEDACDLMEQTYAAVRYSKITVTRHWSKHKPVISGKTIGLSLVSSTRTHAIARNG